MAIIGYLGPSALSIQPAYRPVFIYGQDSGVPPVMYCDVYFDGTYYKTLSSNTVAIPFGFGSLFKFDLSGLAQEYIQTLIYDITTPSFGAVYGAATGAGIPKNGQVNCYCKLRSSTTTGGIVVPETPVPVQRTMDTAAVAGGGMATNDFYIVNAAPQHLERQNFESWLGLHRILSKFGVGVATGYKVYPLTYQKDALVHVSDYGQFPFIIVKNGLLGGSAANMKVVVVLRDSSGGVVYSATTAAATMIDSGTIYTLGCGPQNLLAAYGTLTTALLEAAEYYYLWVLNDTTGAAVLITPNYYLDRKGISPAYNTLMPYPAGAVREHTRIWYQNYLGQLEAVNFTEREERVKVTSNGTERPLTTVPISAARSAFGMGRNNVRANDLSEAVVVLDESQLPLIKQLVGTSRAFVEFVTPEASGEASRLLVPIRLLDGDYVTQVVEGRYEYRLAIKYEMANEHNTIR